MSLTAVLFIRHISAVIPTITDPGSEDTKTCVRALELVFSAGCTDTFKTLVMSRLIQ